MVWTRDGGGSILVLRPFLFQLTFLSDRARETMERTRLTQEIAFPPCGHLGVLLNKPATHRSLLKV